MKKKKVSDSMLSRLWSVAVKAKYKRCPVTGATEDLQSHHIVAKGRQNRFCLRWDIRNGVPLHPDVHRRLHDGDMDVQEKLIEYVTERGDKDYLMRLKNMMKHEFLSVHLGMSEDEYRLKTMAELKKIIDES